jgi:lipid-binding SYLF domain-containing protein
VVGGEHGKGVATCRTENGAWSSPAPFAVSGTYSSSKGAFIGASLNGAELNQDHDATREWYGSMVWQ